MPARPRIDLHAHSNASDGTDPPADVVRRAHAAGLDVVALTDHDTVDGLDEAVAALPHGLTLVSGCEISCVVERPDVRVGVHLLGYLFDPAEPAFAAERVSLRNDRERRARAMVDRLRALGARVTWEEVRALAGDAPVGRPHVARALVDAGVVPDLDAAFTDEWIATGGRAYVPKRAVGAVVAIRLVIDAGGLAVIAHPRAPRGPVLDDDEIAELARAGLAGIEVDHPDHDLDTRRHLTGLAGELGLLVTGSSDDHGEFTGRRLGVETTDPDVYEALAARATGAQPIRS